MSIIREAAEQDVDTLSTLYQQCCHEAGWLPESAKQTIDFVRDTQGERLWVALDSNEQIVGFVAVWMPDSFIHHLYVASAARGRGVGSALLKTLAGQVPLPWRLKCLKANVSTQGFYLCQGWNIVGEGEDASGAYQVMRWGD